MRENWLLLALLALWALLFGLFHVTNIRVDWGHTIMGLAALALGIACIVAAIRKSGP